MNLIQKAAVFVCGLSVDQKGILLEFLKPIPGDESVSATVELSRKHEDALSAVTNALERFRQTLHVDYRILRLVLLNHFKENQAVSVGGQFSVGDVEDTTSPVAVSIVDFTENPDVEFPHGHRHSEFLVVHPMGRGIETDMRKHFPVEHFASGPDIEAVTAMLARDDPRLSRKIRQGGVVSLYARTSSGTGEFVVLFSLLDTKDRSRGKYILSAGQCSSWARDLSVLVPF